MSPYWLLLIVPALGLLIYGLHCLALWAEKRGWIYYRKSAGSATVGNALLELQTMVDPGMAHVLEVRLEEGEEQQESGDPPEPGQGTEEEPG